MVKSEPINAERIVSGNLDGSSIFAPTHRICGETTCDMFDPRKSICYMRHEKTSAGSPCFYWLNAHPTEQEVME